MAETGRTHKASLPGGINSARRSGAIYNSGRHGYRKDLRREEAEARATARAARTPEQQIANLDAILGVGIGAKKERARLAKVSS